MNPMDPQTEGEAPATPTEGGDMPAAAGDEEAPATPTEGQE